MERIELYDRYINGTLIGREDFDVRLKEDKEFADDFKVYLLTVEGICRKAEQDNLDLGIALKHISNEMLREIVGKKSKKSVYLPPRSGIYFQKTNIINQ